MNTWDDLEDSWQFNMADEIGVLATPSDACREYAAAVGSEHPDRAWILTDYDTWEPNPYYVGPPRMHPEMVGEDDEDDIFYPHHSAHVYDYERELDRRWDNDPDRPF